MQNELDNGKELYHEYKDESGFIIREIIGSGNPDMRFQAGHHIERPMMLPVYGKRIVTHHVPGDEIRIFHMQGHGRTRAIALENASNAMIREDIAKSKVA